MKRRIVLSAIAAAALSGGAVHAQINSATAAGYMARGVAMYNDKNYEGCLDQLLQVRHLDPAVAQQEEAQYYMAMATLYFGDDEALALLEDFRLKYPQSPRYNDVTAAIGDYYFTRGSYAEALRFYLSVEPETLTDDRRDDMLYREAYSLMLLGDNSRSHQIFDRLTTTVQYGNAANFYLGYIAYLERNYDLSMAYFRKVDTTRDPGTAADYYIAQIYFMDKDYSQALHVARKMLEGDCIGQFRPEMNRVVGESLYNLGDEAGAIKYLKDYVSETADVRPTAYYILGVSEYNAGNYTTAVDMLSQAADMPDSMGQSAYLYLGQCYVKEGNTDGALMAFEKAFRDSYDERIAEEAFYNYIVARVNGGRVPFGKSVSMMEEFLNKYPRSRYAEDVRQNLVTGYMSDNDYESALRIINATRNPSAKMIEARQRVLFMLGTRDYQLNKLGGAIDYLSEAVSVNGANSGLHRQSLLWLGNAQLDAGQLDEAAGSYLEYLEEAPANDDNRTLAYYNLGYTRFRQNRWDDAMVNFRRVADAGGVSGTMKADALNRLADCLYYKDRPDEAATVYTSAFEANPQAGDYALYQAALMKGRQGDNVALVDAMDDMMKRFPSSALVPSAMLEKAQAFVAMDQIADALDTYSTLAASYPSTQQGRNALLQLAVTNLNRGDNSAAIEAYKDVITKYPTSEEAEAAVDDLKQLYAADGKLPEFAEFLESVPNAPQMEASALDVAAFQAAENDYIDNQQTGKLEAYLRDYPTGAYEAQALYYLAENASNAGDSDTALEYITRILTEFPDAEVAENALLLKGDNELNLGKTAVALNTYRELETRASGNMLHDARMGALHASLDLHRYDEVIELADKLSTSSNPGITDFGEIAFSRAEALDAKGDTEEAYNIWSKLAETPSDVYGAKSSVYMAQSLLEQGNVEKARNVADALINAGTPHNYWLARAFIVLSDALRKQGKTFEANEYLKSLKENYPDTDEDIFLMINERLSR